VHLDYVKILFTNKMHLLLNIWNVKIYIKKILYSLLHISVHLVCWVLCIVRRTLHNTQYTHHNLKHMLSQHCKTYNDVFLLINSTKV
jgi:hypothetical protein